MNYLKDFESSQHVLLELECNQTRILYSYMHRPTPWIKKQFFACIIMFHAIFSNCIHSKHLAVWDQQDCKFDLKQEDFHMFYRLKLKTRLLIPDLS